MHYPSLPPDPVKQQIAEFVVPLAEGALIFFALVLVASMLKLGYSLCKRKYKNPPPP
jgi:hypothetical protein